MRPKNANHHRDLCAHSTKRPILTHKRPTCTQKRPIDAHHYRDLYAHTTNETLAKVCVYINYVHVGLFCMNIGFYCGVCSTNETPEQRAVQPQYFTLKSHIYTPLYAKTYLPKQISAHVTKETYVHTKETCMHTQETFIYTPQKRPECTQHKRDVCSYKPTAREICMHTPQKRPTFIQKRRICTQKRPISTRYNRDLYAHTANDGLCSYKRDLYAYERDLYLHATIKT